MCKKCHQETLFVSEPIYEGFKKIGESLRCNGCGAVQRSDKIVVPKADPLAALFGEDLAPEKLNLFDVDAETAHLCRKCANYVIHPFTQRCSLHDREVSATDSCDQWEAKE